jgi:hypothetical protein
MNSIKMKLVNIDAYGTQLTLKNSNSRTSFGGILSVLTLFIMSVAVITKVKLVSSEIKSQNEEFVDTDIHNSRILGADYGD